MPPRSRPGGWLLGAMLAMVPVRGGLWLLCQSRWSRDGDEADGENGGEGTEFV